MDAFSRCRPSVPTAICSFIACSTTFSSIKISHLLFKHFEVVSNVFTDPVHFGEIMHIESKYRLLEHFERDKVMVRSPDV